MSELQSLMTFIVILETVFWICLMQVDSMFWTFAGYHRMCEVYWIPEFANTKLDWFGRAKNIFIIFCGLVIITFHTVVAAWILSI